MPKYDRRLVARNSLTEIETAVIELEQDRWVLDPTVPDEKSGTLLSILRKMRLQPNGVSIAVPMRREIIE